MNAQLEHLSFYFRLDQEDIIEHIEIIIAQLEQIVKIQEEYAPEFTSYVPQSILQYWQEEAKRAALAKEDIDKLVEQRVHAWIAGWEEKLRQEKKTVISSQELIEHLKSQETKLKEWLTADEKRIQKTLSPLEKTLKKSLESSLLSQAPRDKTVRKNLKAAAAAIAEKTTEILSRSPEISHQEAFRKKLGDVLEKEVEKNPITKDRLGKKEAVQIASNLARHYDQMARALEIRTEQTEKIGWHVDYVSATNPPREQAFNALAEEIVKQIEAPKDKTAREVWGEIKSGFKEWFFAQNYPFQTVLALIKGEPGVFKGGAQEIFKNIKEAFSPGLPLKSQLLFIVSASPEELASFKYRTIQGAWNKLWRPGRFEAEFLKLKTAEDQEPFLAQASGLLKNYFEEMDERGYIPSLGKQLAFKEMEDFSRFVQLLANIEKIETFAKEHRLLAGALRTLGRAYAFPLRHQKAYFIYQLAKCGPYAGLALSQFLKREVSHYLARMALVKLTSWSRFGWELKEIPLTGLKKVVWKPSERIKNWFKEKLGRLLGRILKRLGLRGLTLIAGAAGLLIVFWKPIKKILKGIALYLLALFQFVLQHGPIAIATFLSTTALSAVGGAILGAAKIGGILGTIAGGLIFGAVGAGIGAGLVYLYITRIAPVISGLTAAPAAGAAAGPGILSQATTGIAAAATPTIVASLGGVMALATTTFIITSGAFIIPFEGEPAVGSKYIKIQKGFDIDGQPQTTTKFPHHDDIIGRNLNYGLTVTIVDKTLTDVVIKDKLEIIKEKATVYQEQTWDKSKAPELAEMKPGDSWGMNYTIQTDESFWNAYISNTVTVTTAEGETQRLILTLTAGKPPVPEPVHIAEKMVKALKDCPGLPKKINGRPIAFGAVVNRSNWPIAKACLENENIPGISIEALERFAGRFQYPQCGHFVWAATKKDIPLKDAKDYCRTPTAGYALLTDWERIKPGDVLATKTGPGHVAIVIKPSVNKQGELIYVQVAEALGTNGVIQLRPLDKNTYFQHPYCGYLRKGG